MRKGKLLLVVVPLLAAGFDYPRAQRGAVVDDYHGTKIADPYRWLEDPDSPETRAWIEAENKLTFGYLEKNTWRARFKQRLSELQDYERFDLPVKEGKRYFYERNSGLQNQSVLYTVDSLDGAPRALLDPNELAADGTVALASYDVSRDARSIVYSLIVSGSDWRDWRVRDVATGKDLPDIVHWSKFSGASWSHDGKGFYYARYDAPRAGTEGTVANLYQKLYYHRLGTAQEKDELILERRDQKEWGFRPTVTDDGRYLVVNVWRGSAPKYMLWVKDLGKKGSKWIEVVDKFEAKTTFIGNIGTRLFLQTDKDASRGRIVSVDLAAGGLAWKTVVPEEKSSLQEVTLVHDTLIVSYLDDAQSRVTLFSPDGKKLRDVPLPGLGSAAGFLGRQDATETFYTFESFAVPPTVYRYDLVSGESSVFRAPKVAFDPSLYETRRVFVTSKDGTRLPLFLTHKKGLQNNGQNPTILYGYGGFLDPMTPVFKVSTMAWVEAGGVFAQAVLRGDGAYGKDFHEAGMLERKQNVFDDFIADAEWLIREKVTSTPRLAIYGGSNGGLLVGAVLNQRPELFGVALPAVGVMDMLRYHKFTIGWGWVPEYGSSDDPAQLKTLLAYSPLHNIKPGTSYPPTFITTADHDDRVVPAHSFKYAATLQAAQAGPAPILIRIETKAGHGSGKPTSKILDEAADRWAFTAQAMKM